MDDAEAVSGVRRAAVGPGVRGAGAGGGTRRRRGGVFHWSTVVARSLGGLDSPAVVALALDNRAVDDLRQPLTA
ncbi:hypothetical protein [Streptomyces sp. IMTB 2501]|uniref:hypothetical protein n=1 Tax=Streptomyces sp. IMTB 2501 TaxID=1776340 RepID=UPI00117C4298|nr:hypothetical protein [Streptomyces sp. IMTB 2501]